MSDLGYDIIVIGGGHAGIEAAVAAVRLGRSSPLDWPEEDPSSACESRSPLRVALVTPDPTALGRMSCNPAIGGTAKGQLVRELSALGGVMGELADRATIQTRTLNLSKGPAIQSTRVQVDRELYEQEASALLAGLPGLEIVKGLAVEVLAEPLERDEACSYRDKGLDDASPGYDATIRARFRVRAVKLADGSLLKTRSLILTVGTFLEGMLYLGLDETPGGRLGEAPSRGLTESLKNLGLTSGRLRTGTPPRIAGEGLDLTLCEEQPGMRDVPPFSPKTDPELFRERDQVSCYLTWTNPRTHEILRQGFDRSPLFTGRLSGIEPRYCPSIEEKLIRFAEKERHQLFLEPENHLKELYYLNGFPTSLPPEIQIEALRTVPGLANLRLVVPGYAVEYDFFPAYQIWPNLETKAVAGLYLAGQINGTSGYEEAAVQGLMAGINAGLFALGRKPFILGRHEAYIGVLIDDLISKVPLEPYRMFTSRAEFRLILREDNAKRRLSAYGAALGLISQEEFREVKDFEDRLGQGMEIIRRVYVKPEEINEYLEANQLSPIAQPTSVSQLLKRGRLELKEILARLETLPDRLESWPPTLLTALTIEARYEGYVLREEEAIKRLLKSEEKRIPRNIDWEGIKGLSTEGRQILKRVNPQTLAQASRLAGVRSSDLSILMIHLRQGGKG